MQLVILRWNTCVVLLPLRLLLFATKKISILFVCCNVESHMNLEIVCGVPWEEEHRMGVDKFKSLCIYYSFLFTLYVNILEIPHMHIHAVLIHMYTYPYIIYRRVRKTADWNKVSVCCKVSLRTTILCYSTYPIDHFKYLEYYFKEYFLFAFL